MDKDKDTEGKKDIVPSDKYIAHKSVFSGDSKIFVLYNKTERVVGALYLVTNFFPAGEPLTLSMRQAGLDLLSVIAFLSEGPAERLEACRDIKGRALEIISYGDIAEAAGYLSPMNARVLRTELVKLVEMAEDAEHAPAAGLALSSELFSVHEGEITPVSAHSALLWGDDKGHKRHETVKDKENVFDTHTRKETPGSSHTQLVKKTSAASQERKVKAIGRTETILGLFKQKDRLSVKDVSAVIKDCGEKTIQRELLSLVEKGVLRKEGERRWSTYLLA